MSLRIRIKVTPLRLGLSMALLYVAVGFPISYLCASIPDKHNHLERLCWAAIAVILCYLWLRQILIWTAIFPRLLTEKEP